jgi:hypothetical protein
MVHALALLSKEGRTFSIVCPHTKKIPFFRQCRADYCSQVDIVVWKPPIVGWAIRVLFLCTSWSNARVRHGTLLSSLSSNVLISSVPTYSKTCLKRNLKGPEHFLLKPGFRLIKIYYDGHGTWKTKFRLMKGPFKTGFTVYLYICNTVTPAKKSFRAPRTLSTLPYEKIVCAQRDLPYRDSDSQRCWKQTLVPF